LPERLEDAALLTGAARFVGDLPRGPADACAHFVRCPYPHARIAGIETTSALAMEGVYAVLTGEDVRQGSSPFIVGVRAPMEHWCLAVDRARYCGEPVAVVLARDRYLAEDAAERIEVEYEPLPAVVDPLEALSSGAPLLHEAVGGNGVHEREFRYGEPERMLVEAAHRVEVKVVYPRNSGTPLEGFVATVEYSPENDAYDVLSNFQGPFSLHPVMARALGVPGPRLRLRSPPCSGGSFGVKQAIFPYLVALALASRKAGRAVHWTEDRLEHLSAATSATNRVTSLQAAVDRNGVVLALDYDQVDDCGAYLRAPEPATLYRMHGNMTGAYAIRHLRIRNRVVLTNKTPSGLNRGFGGPQVYFALETLMRRVAETLGLEPLEVIRRNLVPPSAMPYRTAAGAELDSGDYARVLCDTCEEGELEVLRARREAARSAGRLYGIGYAAIVEPSVSNMGYITTLLTAPERARAGPKNGGISYATVTVDPSGGISVSAASTPQGQGHRTVLAQVVAEVLGVAVDEVSVNLELDTAKDAWTISSGNYSSRFAAAVAGTAYRAALALRAKLAAIAAPVLNCRAERLGFANGWIRDRENPDNALSLGRAAGLAHWSPGDLPPNIPPGVRETAVWTPPSLAAPGPDDRVNSSAAYGFVFDVCAVEIDRGTGRLRIDRYVTGHDAGRLLHRELADGQIRGGFAQALGAALFEELRYDREGNFLTGSFADYPPPTVMEVPEPLIVHRESPSPVTPLGAKGLGEGNSMSTPVCIANAVADALGRETVTLPLTPSRICAYLNDPLEPSGSIR